MALQWTADLFRVSPCLCSRAAVTGLELGDPEWEGPVLKKMDGWIKSDFKQHNEKQNKKIIILSNFHFVYSMIYSYPSEKSPPRPWGQTGNSPSLIWLNAELVWSELFDSSKLDWPKGLWHFPIPEITPCRKKRTKEKTVLRNNNKEILLPKWRENPEWKLDRDALPVFVGWSPTKLILLLLAGTHQSSQTVSAHLIRTLLLLTAPPHCPGDLCIDVILSLEQFHIRLEKLQTGVVNTTNRQKEL